VEIRDNGKGMTSDEAGEAFSPFFSTKAHGTGLGLSIVRQIIEQHQGEITLESQPGVGTRVVIELPVREPAEPGSVST
jgi:signal transduction histidine kinase